METSSQQLTKEEKIIAFSEKILNQIQQGINERETPSPLWNYLSYSEQYEENLKRALNAVKPKKKNDGKPDVDTGLVAEKVFNFISIYQNQEVNENIRIYEPSGEEKEHIGEFFKLAVRHTQETEKFKKQILPFIYFTMVSQGDAFVWDDWYVETLDTKDIYDENGKKIDFAKLDHTFETYEKLKYKKGKKIQNRYAKTRLLDGRTIIFGDISQPLVQEQPWIALEFVISNQKAEAVFGSLENFKKLKKDLKENNFNNGNSKNFATIKTEFSDLFNRTRKKEEAGNESEEFIIHYYFNKADNLFNIFVNGVPMFNIETPLNLVQPRMNYPIIRFGTERISSSIYSRSIPAKAKFNADYLDKILMILAKKFEKSYKPPINAKNKYKVRPDLLDAGKVNTGITSEDYEFADPNFQGISNSDITMVNMLKEILEGMTLNKTTSGEVSGQTTATEVSMAQRNQLQKLIIYFESLEAGFEDLISRRIETIESKFTKQQDWTIVDGKKVSVYKNFSVSLGGSEHYVAFLDSLKEIDPEKQEDLENDIFMLEAQHNIRYHLINPDYIRKAKYEIIVEVKLEPKISSIMESAQLREEITWLKQVFPNVNNKLLEEEYIKATDRSEDLFLPQEIMAGAGQEQQPQGAGTGEKQMKPTVAKNVNI